MCIYRSRLAMTMSVLSLMVGVLFAGSDLTAAAPAHAGTATGHAASWAGVPVRRATLPAPLRLAGAGPAWRVWYLSTAFDGRPTLVSGTLTLPAGRAPRGGWPVVSFGHGYDGTPDACAPSRTGPTPWERTLQERLLAAGYAIAVTDLDGIGTPGESSVVNGPSEGYAVIDIVRAAHRLAGTSRSWVAVGYSLGGHAALFAGALASRYAPELRLGGTVALAPVTQWGLQLQSPPFRDPNFPLSPVLPFSLRSFQVTHAGQFRPTDWLTATGLHLLDVAGQVCLDQMTTAVAGISNGQAFLDTPALADEAARLMAGDEVIVQRYDRPVRLAHGTADGLPSVLTEVTFGQLAAAGSDVTYLPVPGADHFTLLPTIAEQVRQWVDQMFAA